MTIQASLFISTFNISQLTNVRGPFNLWGICFTLETLLFMTQETKLSVPVFVDSAYGFIFFMEKMACSAFHIIMMRALIEIIDNLGMAIFTLEDFRMIRNIAITTLYRFIMTVITPVNDRVQAGLPYISQKENRFMRTVAIRAFCFRVSNVKKFKI